jgi:hypothetical protein
MGARYSDEQWKDLKMKIQLGILALVVGAAAYLGGPGIGKIVNYAKKNKEKPWAAKWMYNCGRFMEMTWRDDQALALYETEIYPLFCGDESKLDWTQVQSEMAFARGKQELSPLDRYFLPWVVETYVPIETRPPWIGGEGAKPNPVLQAALYRVLKHYEDRRDSLRVQHLYKACLRTGAFPPDDEASQRMLDAERRGIMRNG